MTRGYVAMLTMTLTMIRPAITNSRFDAIVTVFGRVRGPGGGPGGLAGYAYVMRVPSRVRRRYRRIVATVRKYAVDGRSDIAAAAPMSATMPTTAITAVITMSHTG